MLQYFPLPEDPANSRMLNATLKRIITGSEVAKNINKNNAQHAIVFEAIGLALALDADPDLLNAGAPALLHWRPLYILSDIIGYHGYYQTMAVSGVSLGCVSSARCLQSRHLLDGGAPALLRHLPNHYAELSLLLLLSWLPAVPF